MVELKFNKPTAESIQFIADNMREEDAAEVMAATNETPMEALLSSIETSKTVIVASYDDVPLVMYGLVKPNILNDIGIIWMLGANQSKKYRREFMHYTRKVIDEMLLECDTLMNYVHTENKTSIRWLTALGFTLEDPISMGSNGATFHEFHMKRDI